VKGGVRAVSLFRGDGAGWCAGLVLMLIGAAANWASRDLQKGSNRIIESDQINLFIWALMFRNKPKSPSYFKA